MWAGSSPPWNYLVLIADNYRVRGSHIIITLYQKLKQIPIYDFIDQLLQKSADMFTWEISQQELSCPDHDHEQLTCQRYKSWKIIT